MILKTNPLKKFLLISFLGLAHKASALNTFECLKDMMAVTDRASFLNKRNGLEEPFLVNNKFIVFPEVSNGTVSGFFFYGNNVAAYYDAVEIKGSSTETRQIGDLVFRQREGIFEMVAQPAGLETVTVPYLPGYQVNASGHGGPVMLGSSVLPVIGAFVSRPAASKTAYHNPAEVNQSDLKRWVAAHGGPTEGGRRPAATEDVTINKTIAKLKTLHGKPQDELMKPLFNELHLRRQWVKTHNLDEKSFKQLSLIMEGSCKE